MEATMTQESRKEKLRKDNRRGQEQTAPKKHKSEEETKDEAYDKTIEDSFPASDPPSSIPDPDGEEDAA
jgi:hypothetical protein